MASDIYLFIYLCTRAQRLSRGFYLACRLGSTSNREDVFVLRLLVDYTFQLLVFLLANFDFFFRFGGSLRPYVLVFETLTAVFIFDMLFIISWVKIRFLYWAKVLNE